MPGAGVHWSALQACPHPELRSHRKPRQCARAAIRARAPTPCAVAGAGLQDCAQRGPGLCGSRMLVSGEAWPLRASPACRAGAPQPRPLRPREEGAPPAPTRPRLRGGLAAGQSHPVSGHPAHPAPTPPGWGTRGSSVAAPISCRPGSRGERAATAPTRLPVVNVRTSQPVGGLTSYRNQGSLPLCGRSVSGKREPRFTSCRWSPFPMRGPQELSCWLL